MRHDAHQSQPKRKSIDKAKYDLETDGGVDEFGEESFRDDRMLFDELRQVV